MRAHTNTFRNGRSKPAAVAELAAKRKELASRKQLTAKSRETHKRAPATNVVELPVGRTNEDRKIRGARLDVDSAAGSANTLIETHSAEKTENVIEKWSANVEQFSRTGAAVSHGFREISREWVSWTRARVQNSQQGFMALMQCRSPHELFEVQSRILSQNLELLTASTRRMLEISSEMTSAVSPKITPAV
jgi:hypothetical protein